MEHSPIGNTLESSRTQRLVHGTRNSQELLARESSVVRGCHLPRHRPFDRIRFRHVSARAHLSTFERHSTVKEPVLSAAASCRHVPRSIPSNMRSVPGALLIMAPVQRVGVGGAKIPERL